MATDASPRTPATTGSLIGRLPRPDRWLMAFLGTRPIDALTQEDRTGGRYDWTAGLTVLCGIVVLLVALIANGSRTGMPHAIAFFYALLAAAFLPVAVRILHPASHRTEHIALVLLLAATVFVIRVVRAPVAFIDHDEFLHWATAEDILSWGRLFIPNSMLPVSPLYPGIEIAATAVAQLTGSALFPAALAVLAIARATLTFALFSLVERITNSYRIASIACLVYMGSSVYLLFDLHFSYESLAVPLLVVALLAGTRGASGAFPQTTAVFVCVPILAALATTHHLTSYFCAALLAAHAILEVLRQGASKNDRIGAVAIACVAFILPVTWSNLMGDPTSDYLGPVFEDGVTDVIGLISHHSARPLFVSDSGELAPLWQRVLTLSGVGLVCLGLLTGFLRSIVRSGLPLAPRAFFVGGWRRWNSSLLVVLTAITLAYPVGLIFRLTRSGWEIGNRIGAFSFLGVAVVVAVAIACFWYRSSRSLLHAGMVASAMTILLISGAISGEGPRILVPATFEVSADSSSVEPMSISAALWTKTWLGPDHVVATDRSNRLLLSTYGGQTIATTLADWRDTGLAIVSERLGRAERALLRDVGVEYVMIDLRISTSLPTVGVYFDGGAADRGRYGPPKPAALLKFNEEPSVDRVFDNGWMILFDTRRMGDAS